MTAPAVTITGTIQDLLGAANAGKVTFLLSNAGSGPPRINGSVMLAPLRSVAQADAGGAFSATLFGNDQITPAGTYYQVTVEDSAGAQIAVAAYNFSEAGTFDLAALTPINPSISAALASSIVLQATSISLTGAVDGVNAVFTLGVPPRPGRVALVFVNGVFYTTAADYNIVGLTLTFVEPPPAGANIALIQL